MINKDIKSFIIKMEFSIKDAMKHLDQTKVIKILFVVDNEDRLFGTITDGDLRRWILSEGDLDVGIINACNKHPFYVEGNFNIDEIKKEMLERKIECIPVVNKSRHIIDILFWADLFQKEQIDINHGQLDIPVIIMAGGMGTRLEPFTRILPKPLIPIGEKPIIEIIIAKFLHYHVNHFYISINYKAKIIKSYFEEIAPEYSIEFIEEPAPLGTVGCIKYLEGKINGPFLITNCDIIIDTDYTDILDFHKKHNYDLTLVASLIHYHIPYGICEIEKNGILIDIKEKPEYSFLVSTGMYILNSSIINLIPENCVFHITHLIDKLKHNGNKVGVYPISEKSWLDTGSWNEYKKTVERFEI